jgi:hypothetical protein
LDKDAVELLVGVNVEYRVDGLSSPFFQL